MISDKGHCKHGEFILTEGCPQCIAEKIQATKKKEVNMAQTKAVATREKAVVKWKGEPIIVTFQDVKNLICPYASDPEAVIFLRTCQSLQLNPFAKEIYLIKYSENDKAAMVIAIDSYLKSAETNDNFNGIEAGIVLRDSGGRLELREGSILLSDETDKLVGGWARVYRKDRERPFYMAVNKAECLRYTREGNLTKFWVEAKQPSMLRKTALKRALVEAFPSLFAGTLSNVEADYEVPEGELPPAYERNGEAYWKLWWAKQKEKGLTEDDVHSFLGVSSLKDDWIEQGRTLEEADAVINAALAQAKKSKKTGAAATARCETKRGTKPFDQAAEEHFTPPDDDSDVAPEEGNFREVEQAGVAAPAEAEKKQPTGAVAPAKPKRDPLTIKTIPELKTALSEDFNLTGKAQLDELNIKYWSDLAEKPADAYQKIAATRK